MHVQTHDLQTLSRGAGFFSNVDMCGHMFSEIAVEVELSISMQRCRMTGRVMETEDGRTEVRLVRMEINKLKIGINTN